MIYQYYMKLFIFLALFFLLVQSDRRIVSRPIQSTYNQHGKANSLIIEWKSTEPIYDTDILKVTLPQPIHGTATSIPFSLSTAHSLSILTSMNSLPYSGGNIYYLPLKANLSSEIWYELRLSLLTTLTVNYGLVQLQVLSKSSLPNVAYSWSGGFQYYHLQQSSIPQQSILSLNINNTLVTTAGARYLTLLQLKSTILVNESVNVTFQFVDYNSTTNLTIDTAILGANKGFIFASSCFARCDYQDIYHSCIQSERCQVSTSSITITLPYMKPNQIYLIEAYVVNPPYVSSVGMEAYWKDNSGRTIAIAFADDLLTVSPINIQSQQIRLLWDIPYATVVGQMGLGLFVNDPAVKHQSLSSFDIGFKVTDVTPIEGQYQVRITVGATSVLQSSINHNLPSLLTTSKISCSYTFPDIICKGVDAFTLKNYRYFVRARGYFITTNTLTSFGNVAIISVNQPNQLFVNLVRGLNVVTVTNADYHDYGGLHDGTSGYRIGQTIIVSHNDTFLPNSTTNAIRNFLRQSASFVGVDPTITPQQLLLFLKVSLDQMSVTNPSAVAQNYTMKLFLNPHIMNTSNLGIDFMSYSSVTQQWNVQNSPCYVDSSTTPTMQHFMCQKFNDHVYNRQIDNTFFKNNNYGLYNWVCGNGINVTCPTTDCSTQCQVLRGGFGSTLLTGGAGVLSIRNVTFLKDYHSPVEAGPNNFDIVLAFYHAGTRVSSTLINGYTLNKTRLANVRADLVNHYHDNTLTNQGSRLPTLLKISGHLTLSEAGSKVIKSIRVYFSSVVSTSNFVETLNMNNLGCSTKNCTASNGGLTKIIDGWDCSNSVQFFGIPSLTQTFNLVFPVVLTTPSKLPQITLSFIQSDGKIGGVFRINGSANSQPLTGPSNHIAIPWTPVSPWLTTLPEWVNQPTLHSFKQSLDLGSIAPFTAYNNINMGTTVMPLTDSSPSTTFASAYLNIFSNYSNPLVDANIKCVDPFSYTYQNSYQVWTLWCPVQPGSLNQIRFNYPLYPDSLGASFPYSMIFSYSYANTLGQMIGYRIQQTIGGQSKICQTQKTTTYDKNSVNPQQNDYLIILSPFQLKPPSRTNFMVTMSLPSGIPMTILSCRAEEPNQNIQFSCNIRSQASNLFKFELIYSGSTNVFIYSIKMAIKSVKSATATITNIELFNITVSLPFTDSATNLASFTGTLYTPFSSVIDSCSNPFTYSSVNSQEYIYLSTAKMTAVTSNYYAKIEFKASFSNSRSTLFDTSTLSITFSQQILTPYSRCQFSPSTHFFSISTIETNLRTITLTPHHSILDFTLTQYQIICTKLLLQNMNNISISMLWKDGSYNIQTTQTPVVAPYTGANSTVSAVGSAIANKFYSSPAYLAQYQINLTLSTTAGDKVMGYVDFGLNHVHELFVECEYLAGTTWTQIICLSRLSDVQSQIYFQLIATTNTVIQLRLYGIKQQKLAVSTLRFLIRKQNPTTLLITTHSSSVSDVTPVDITTNPIQILSFMVNSSSVLTINYTLPTTYSSSFYVQFDQLFKTYDTDTYSCWINSTVVSCRRVRPDLLLISNTLNHGFKYNNLLIVKTMRYFYKEKYDNEEVHFSMFIATPNRSQIMYGSHEHLENPLRTVDLNLPQSLIWQIPSNQFNSVCQLVYVGYFGPPAQLMTSPHLPFNQSFNYTYNVTSNFIIIDNKAELGLNVDSAFIGTFDATAVGFRNLVYNHDSAYSSISTLPIYVSSEKCTPRAQFDQYNIINGGVTIPIAINMSACRPMSNMSVSTAINTAFISADGTLTTKTLSWQSQMLFVVLNHAFINTTIGQSFQLKVSLNSSNLTVQNAYNAIPNITINVIDRSLLIGNPEAKQPVINYLTHNSIQLRLQCNTPATIYWGVGIYPTMLGITVQQIQTRLIQKDNGLAPKTIDIYSWSQEVYGLDYVHDFNIQKNVTINGLEGGLDYVFKYFCVDQTGKASGGKITRFNSLQSNNSLMKVTLGFSSQLTFWQVNEIGCSISEQLTIPYNETISSVHSNCINNTEIYHQKNSYYYDQKSTTDINYPYLYFFYVDTVRVTIRNITSILVASLGKNSVFMDALIPYYGSMRVDSLYNSYQPTIYSMSLAIKRTEFTITVDVGLANTYLIAAIMGSHFNPVTQSLPTHYLMKQGFFSLGTKFDQIFSIYGRQKISVTFRNLTEGSKFSVFYFVAVDNSALNARHSKVEYRDLVTNIYQIVDLWNNCLHILAILIVIMLAVY